MILEHKKTLSAYLDDLLSSGKIVFSRKEALAALGVDQGAFLDSAERLQKQHRLISPRQGFYVVVPPQYLFWGSPPPAWYVDDLMRHEGRSYYVGLLKAAELHGATHQAVMEFQIITDKRMPRISAGRSVLSFYYRKELEAIRAGIEERKTDTGRMKISSVELTALDLLRYPHASGGINHIATVLSDLGKKIDAGKLSALAPAFERPAVQRTGWLLDHLGFQNRTEKMHRRFLKETQRPWTELEPSIVGDPDLTPLPLEKSKRWNLVIRRMPEVDE
jgi:predicted transcriptional regulator of viral defense system